MVEISVFVCFLIHSGFSSGFCSFFSSFFCRGIIPKGIIMYRLSFCFRLLSHSFWILSPSHGLAPWWKNPQVDYYLAVEFLFSFGIFRG